MLPPSRRTIIWIILLATLACLSLLIPQIKSGAGDLEVFIRGGERMKAGESIYRNELHAFTYPPFVGVPFALLASVPDDLQRPLWYFANFTSLAAIIALIWRRLSPYVRDRAGAIGPPLWAFWLLVALLSGRHLLAPITNQQYDLIVFLLVMLAIDHGCRGFEARGGMFAGLAAASKATPLLFLPMFFWQWRWAAMLVMMVTAGLATILPDALHLHPSGVTWVKQWFGTFVSKVTLGESPDVDGAWTKWNMLNQSLTGTVYRLSTPVPEPSETMFDVSVWKPGDKLTRGFTMALQLLIVLFLWMVTRRGLTSRSGDHEFAYRRLGEGAALVCAMVLLSPMSSKAHFCVLLLPIAFCVSDVLYHRRSPFVLACLVMIFLLGTATATDIVGKPLSREILARGSVTWSALAALLATGSILLRREVPE